MPVLTSCAALDAPFLCACERVLASVKFRHCCTLGNDQRNFLLFPLRISLQMSAESGLLMKSKKWGLTRNKVDAKAVNRPHALM